MEEPPHHEWDELRGDEEAYKAFILSKKEVILSNYAALEPVLPLIRELAQAGPIGDTYMDLESEYIQFRTIRDCLQALVFYTELTYFDETLEADSDDLHAMIQLQQNWVGHIRILVNAMIAIVALEEGFESVQRLLPHLSPAEVQKWHKQLSPSFDAVAVVSNALYGEYCSISTVVESLEDEGGGRLPFFFHKNRTLNIYGRHLDQVVHLAQKRDWEEMSQYWEEFESKLEFSLLRRNHMGWLILAMALPATTKVYENADELNVKQGELLALLEQGLGQ